MPKRENIKRNIKIFKDVALGMSYKEVSDRERITTTRARQIVESFKRALTHHSRLGDTAMPSDAYHDVHGFRKHSDFWIKQIDKFDIVNDPYVKNY